MVEKFSQILALKTAIMCICSMANSYKFVKLKLADHKKIVVNHQNFPLQKTSYNDFIVIINLHVLALNINILFHFISFFSRCLLKTHKRISPVNPRDSIPLLQRPNSTSSFTFS